MPNDELLIDLCEAGQVDRIWLKKLVYGNRQILIESARRKWETLRLRCTTKKTYKEIAKELKRSPARIDQLASRAKWDIKRQKEFRNTKGRYPDSILKSATYMSAVLSEDIC